MPLEVALAVRPPNQIIKRSVTAGVVIAVGVAGFIAGNAVGAAKQSAVDQTEFRAWRDANACVEVPGFLRGDTKTYPKKHGVQ